MISNAMTSFKLTSMAYMLIIGVAVLCWAMPPEVSAQEPPLEAFEGREGAYDVAVSIMPPRPIIGSIHFIVELAEAETSQPVRNAEVVVLARHQEERLAFQARALSTPDAPAVYRSNLTLNTPGPWLVEVRIGNASLGEATATFPLEIAPSSAGLGGTGAVVLLGIMLALVGGVVYLWYSSRKRLREIRGQQTHQALEHPRY